MTRAEKRYFKLFTGRHMPGGHSTTQVLFDAIAAMDEYDEPGLLLRFRDQAFTKRFAITKRRLYETILKSLDAFHAEGSVDVRLHRLLHHVELLYQKALYEDASKMLQSVRRLARQHDRQAVLLAALQWERRLLECGNYAAAGPADLDRIASEGQRLHEEQAEVDILWDLKSRVLMDLYRHGQARDQQGLKGIQDQLQHPLLKDPANLLTARAQFLFHHLHSAAAYAAGNLSVCHKHLTANRMVLFAGKDKFSDDPNLVLGVLSNLVHVSMRLGHYDEAFQVLSEFRTIPSVWNMPETEDLELKLFSTSSSLELAIHCQMGAFDKALGLVSAVERGLERHQDQLGPVRKAGFYYQLAYAHFGAGQVDKALKWTHRLLNDVRIDDSAEIVCFGRMLNLLAQLEAGKKDLIPYTLRNTERYLQSRKRAHHFEQVFLDMVRAALRATDHSAMTDVYEQFLADVLPLDKDPGGQAVLDHLDPIAWAESKLSGRLYAELVKERAMKVANAA